MRPVLLNMTGFASFREPTEVDFRGADYFALVGPTGAGKSTVIDAMTFALYGTVPRWDDRRKVAFALAPTVNRGTVKLVFDVGGQRYLVARELRRSGGANPQVSVKNARLERLLDADGLGEVDDPCEVIAADSFVTPGIEQLLGLEFDHFCTCVSLPQGDFAEFLHAKPSDRQRILTKLLGLGVYENIAREAGVEASQQRSRAAVLGEQLVGFLDVTDEAEQAAAARVVTLEAIAETVDAAVPELIAASQAIAVKVSTVTRLTDERDRLATLTIPQGMGELDERRARSEELLASADLLYTAAEQADTAAREARRRAPERGPLDKAARDHADLATALDAEPATVDACDQAKVVATAATNAANLARAAAELARQRNAVAIASHETAQSTVNALLHERDLLRGLHLPAGIGEIGSELLTAQESLNTAKQELAAAENADDAARTALAEAPASGPLELIGRYHDELADTLEKLPALEDLATEAGRKHAAASDAVEHAKHRQSQLREARDRANRANLAAALRPQLAIGDDCPVCAQQVAVLPPALPDADAHTAEEALTAAERDVGAAQRAEVGAERAAGKAAADLDDVLERVRLLRESILDGPSTRAEVDKQLSQIEAVAAAAKKTDSQLRAARSAHDRAVTAADQARAARDSTAHSLRSARDPLAPLGAPLVGDDIVADSVRLQAWAREEAALRDERLEEARVKLTAVTDELSASKAEVAGTDVAESAARKAETAAAAAVERAEGQCEALTANISRLHTALAGAPDPDTVAASLAAIDELDAAADEADRSLREARNRLTTVRTTNDQIRTEVTTAQRILSATRDPFVGLGAPPLGGDDLLADWTALVTWARTEVTGRAELLTVAQSECEDLKARFEVDVASLGSVLTNADVSYRRDIPLVDGAGAAVATALTQSLAAQARLVERRGQAVKLREEQTAAEEAAQVAAMLANLLRSNNFPRWLVASALDVLVIEASASLAELSGGQFELTHDDGEFLIVDHADADSRRPVRTLSGGETFQASLALALALSSQMGTLAAAGAARLDSIFLDEGFGTLDESTLEVVAATLENLAHQGNRMVGVITHVSALAERIPVRFTVKRDQLTSSVVREGP